MSSLRTFRLPGIDPLGSTLTLATHLATSHSAWPDCKLGCKRTGCMCSPRGRCPRVKLACLWQARPVGRMQGPAAVAPSFLAGRQAGGLRGWMPRTAWCLAYARGCVLRSHFVPLRPGGAPGGACPPAVPGTPRSGEAAVQLHRLRSRRACAHRDSVLACASTTGVASSARGVRFAHAACADSARWTRPAQPGGKRPCGAFHLRFAPVHSLAGRGYAPRQQRRPWGADCSARCTCSQPCGRWAAPPALGRTARGPPHPRGRRAERACPKYSLATVR